MRSLHQEKLPWKEQLKVAELIGGGQDCIPVAGYGWGKTLTYFLPLLYWIDRSIVIVSPLKGLADEQKLKLQELGILGIVLKKGTIPTKNNISDIANGTYRAVFITPEVIFGSPSIENLWHDKDWRRRLMAVILDEAHCDMETMKRTVRWEPQDPAYTKQVMQILVDLNNDIESKRVVDTVEYDMLVDLTAPESK
ncbi:hypothetical protein BGW39_009805 [Mortierella sp. 14UC]|nr:hypothetical protein BGW39_009805 [Mortierella sp. 14UC]